MEGGLVETRPVRALEAARAFGVMLGGSVALAGAAAASTGAVARAVVLRRRPAALPLLGTAATVLYALVIRPWHRRWGAEPQDEQRELQALLSRARLLTLTGTGGAGKTRLALELARRTEESYRDGAVFVELAPVTDPRLVVEAVGAALDVRAFSGSGLAEAISEFLASRSLLVVFDNCEHVLGACAALVDRLLRSAPEVTILTTSREPLKLPGEIVFRVPSLAIPDPDIALGPADLLRHEAVQLFVERAAAAAPGFELETASAADVARICFRLDGLPLALELAAGRLGALGSASPRRPLRVAARG